MYSQVIPQQNYDESQKTRTKHKSSKKQQLQNTSSQDDYRHITDILNNQRCIQANQNPLPVPSSHHSSQVRSSNNQLNLNEVIYLSGNPNFNSRLTTLEQQQHHQFSQQQAQQIQIQKLTSREQFPTAAELVSAFQGSAETDSKINIVDNDASASDGGAIIEDQFNSIQRFSPSQPSQKQGTKKSTQMLQIMSAVSDESPNLLSSIQGSSTQQNHLQTSQLQRTSTAPHFNFTEQQQLQQLLAEITYYLQFQQA